jgi:hypothetical protein
MSGFINRWVLGRKMRGLAYAVPIAAYGAMFPASPAAAAPPLQPFGPFEITVPAGLGCPNFDLRITVDEGVNRVFKEFHDRNGNLVRVISAGRGATETLTNVLTDTSVTFKTGGSVSRTTPNPDGTYTLTLTGHNIVIVFPTDEPPGPRSTLYLGRVVFTISDPVSNTILGIQQTSGKQVDICAILGS